MVLLKRIWLLGGVFIYCIITHLLLIVKCKILCNGHAVDAGVHMCPGTAADR